jgi:hypothetical protein
MSETQITALKLFEPDYEETSVFLKSQGEVTKNEMMSSKNLPVTNFSRVRNSLLFPDVTNYELKS